MPKSCCTSSTSSSSSSRSNSSIKYSSSPSSHKSSSSNSSSSSSSSSKSSHRCGLIEETESSLPPELTIPPIQVFAIKQKVINNCCCEKIIHKLKPIKHCVVECETTPNKYIVSFS